MEQEILAKGIQPQSMDWPERAKYWFFGHGGSLDPDTGAIIFGPQITAAAQRFYRAREIARSGSWQPRRDRDELTFALGNPEHGGRTRGYGALSWEHAFLQDRDTYRSHQIKKEE